MEVFRCGYCGVLTNSEYNTIEATEENIKLWKLQGHKVCTCSFCKTNTQASNYEISEEDNTNIKKMYDRYYRKLSTGKFE